MTHWKTQFNYDYLGAYSLPDGKDIILTIRETKKEQVVGASGKKEECFVAYFFENVKPMILNRTNCKTLTKIFKNPNFESWINKQIQIGAVLVDAFGEKVDSLRIRPFIPKVETSLSAVETGSVIWKNTTVSIFMVTLSLVITGCGGKSTTCSFKITRFATRSINGAFT